MLLRIGSNRGVAHENGSIESSNGHLKRAIEDALIMRGSREFEDLPAYRRFVDEIVSRINVRNTKRIDAERASLRPLPASRAIDYEEVTLRVTSSSGFTLRKVFYTVPSRLIGHRLRVRLYDDRLELFLGGSALMTLKRGRTFGDGSRAHVVNYHHIIHSLRKKPMALIGVVYRDQLFPRQAFRDTFTTLLEQADEKTACRMTVELLALAHDRGCEAELAEYLEEDLRQHRIPDILALRTLFGPSQNALPNVKVAMGDLVSYNQLITRTAQALEMTP